MGSNARLTRAIILLIILAAVIYIITIAVFNEVNNVSDIAIETNGKGNLVFKVSKKTGESVNEKYAQLLLPSNSCWFNTGLDIKEDEEFEITVTGTVHLAFNRLYKDVDNDMIPKIRWTGPEGNEWAQIGDEKERHEAKSKLLIKLGDRIGNVLA